MSKPSKPSVVYAVIAFVAKDEVTARKYADEVFPDYLDAAIDAANDMGVDFSITRTVNATYPLRGLAKVERDGLTQTWLEMFPEEPAETPASIETTRDRE